MDSYKFMFNACRYPAKPSDYEMTFDPVTNNHITVIRKNKFFILDLFKDGVQLSTAEIEKYNMNLLVSMPYINIFNLQIIFFK